MNEATDKFTETKLRIKLRRIFTNVPQQGMFRGPGKVLLHNVCKVEKAI